MVKHIAGNQKLAGLPDRAGGGRQDEHVRDVVEVDHRTGQDNTTQHKTRQDKIRQGKTRQHTLLTMEALDFTYSLVYF